MVALLARLAARYLPAGSPLAAAAAAKPRLSLPGRLGPTAARASSSLRPLDMGPPPPPLLPRTRSAARTEPEAQAAQLQPEALRLARVASNLEASCSGAPPAPPVSARHAAVLVPLFEDAEGVVRVILTQRASSLPTHSGEVCLPGGKRDPGDADDAATALREAQEELGIPPAACRLLGALPPFLSKHLLSVAPVLAVVPSDLRFTPNPAEVAAVFAPPLRLFLRPGAAHSHRDVEWEPGIKYRLHYFDYLDPASATTFCIWGLTAGMLVVVAERAYREAPAFRANPPGVPAYTALHHDGQRLVFRGGRLAGGEVAGSAAAEGARVTDAEAAAAVGEAAEAQPEEVFG